MGFICGKKRFWQDIRKHIGSVKGSKPGEQPTWGRSICRFHKEEVREMSIRLSGLLWVTF